MNIVSKPIATIQIVPIEGVEGGFMVITTTRYKLSAFQGFLNVFRRFWGRLERGEKYVISQERFVRPTPLLMAPKE